MLSADLLAPRRCFLKPISEILEAAELLSAAVDAHLAGDAEAATTLIRRADMDALSEWRKKLMGPVNPQITRFREVAGAPPSLPKEGRIGLRMPSSVERRMIIERDGYHCRFCGMPVIEERVRKAIRRAYPEALRWGKPNAERHAAFLCMWLQYDHILPHSRGGDSTLDNVVTTCAPCNYGRGEYTIEEVGLIDPRTVPGERSPWDGLERFLFAERRK